VDARSFLQSKNKKEIVLMKVVNQVLTVQYLLHIPDAEPAGVVLFLGR
jgi:hypothetical protein